MRSKSRIAKILLLIVIWLGISWLSRTGEFRFLEGPHEDLFWRIRWRLQGSSSDRQRVKVFPITKDFLSGGSNGAWISWPLPRTYYAKAIRRLSDLGVAVIGFDILFPPEASSSETADLLDAISKSKAKIVLGGQVEKNRGYFDDKGQDDEEGYSFKQGTESVVLPNQQLVSAAHGVGMLNFEKGINEDDVVRRHPLLFRADGENQLSLALKIYVAWKGIEGVPALEGSNLRLPDGLIVPLEPIATATNPGSEWAAHPVWEMAESGYGFGPYTGDDFGKLVSNDYRPSPDRFKGDIALIGVGSDLLGDTISIPGNPVAPGVLLHASLLNSLVRKRFMTRLDQGWLLSLSEALLLGMCILGLLAELWLPTLAGILANLGLFLAVEGTVFLLFIAGFLIHLGPVLVGFPLAVLGIYVTGYFFEGREKKLVRELFGKQVSPEVVRTLLENPQESLAPRRQEISICFIDVCSFTSFSEKHTPERVLVQLNYYFSQLLPIVHKNGGSLDKFIGDAMMITTGVPIPSPDHAFMMVKIALEILEKIEKINKNLPMGIQPFQVSIGINSGESIMGNIGSAERMEYTVIGDTVNLASRLQGKAGHQEIIIGPRTFFLIGDRIAVESLEPFLVKGKDTPVQAYRVVGFQAQGSAKEKLSGG